jgi:hypothetical protein
LIRRSARLAAVESLGTLVPSLAAPRRTGDACVALAANARLR